MTAATELAIAADPCAVFHASGMKPDPWQVDLLHSDQPTLALCTRQAGKTETGAALALHTAVAKPRSLSLITAPSDRQAGEAFRKVGAFYKAAFGQVLDDDVLTSRRLELANGSRVIAVHGHDDATLRVFSAVSLLVIDEACRVKDQVISALTPMLATTNGRLVCLTTAWFRAGYFYRQWTSEGDGWLRVEVTADDIPRISREFLGEERKRKTPLQFAQEYHCAWGADGTPAYDQEFVEAAMRDDIELYRPDRTRLV